MPPTAACPYEDRSLQVSLVLGRQVTRSGGPDLRNIIINLTGGKEACRPSRAGTLAAFRTLITRPSRRAEATLSPTARCSAAAVAGSAAAVYPVVSWYWCTRGTCVPRVHQSHVHHPGTRCRTDRHRRRRAAGRGAQRGRLGWAGGVGAAATPLRCRQERPMVAAHGGHRCRTDQG